MRSSLPLAAALLPSLAMFAAACAETPQSHVPVEASRPEPLQFPTPVQIAEVAAAPVPARLFEEGGKDVPTWDLTGALPEAIDDTPHAPEGAWEQVLADAAISRPGKLVATEALHCVARETAAFYLDNEALPAEQLTHFMAARCGAPVSSVSAGVQGFKVDDRVPEPKLYAEFQATAKKLVGSFFNAESPLDVGVAFQRKNGRAAFALASLPRQVRMGTTSFVPGPSGTIVVQGELLTPAANVEAMVNRGRFSYARCARADAVSLPKFSFTCEPLREDEAAWLDVVAFPPGRVLGTPVVDTLVWPSGAPGKTYQKLASSPPPASAAAPTAAVPGGSIASAPDLVRAINEVRKEASLPPVRLADKETESAGKLAPHYFAAMHGSEPGERADVVALGLRAGWQVDGMVRYSNFVSTTVYGAGDYRDILRDALRRPIGRQTLLDPTAERVAIGVVGTESENVVGAIFTSYELFDSYRHDRDAPALVARLALERAQRGLSAPAPLGAAVAADAERAAQAVQAGTRSPNQALGALLEQARNRLARTVQGWVVETNSLDAIQFPPELTARPALGLSVAVAHYKPAGQPWGRFVVLVVSTSEATPTVTARAGTPRAG